MIQKKNNQGAPAEQLKPDTVSLNDDILDPNCGNITIIQGINSEVMVKVRGENIREKELAYLDNLLTRYENWRNRHIPFAVNARSSAAMKKPSHLFIPLKFERLIRYNYGTRIEIRVELVDDLEEAIVKHRRIILLGDPGSGKSTALWQMAYNHAIKAYKDPQSPLPVLVPLGEFADHSPIESHLERHLGPLSDYLAVYRAAGRLILLLDGLDEMPRSQYKERINHVFESLDQYPQETTIITCQSLDWSPMQEGYERVRIAPLDNECIRVFLKNHLGAIAGEQLFECIVEDDKLIALLDAVRYPYLLLIAAQVYSHTNGKLPTSRAQLFQAFVDITLRNDTNHQITPKIQKDALSTLAYAIQAHSESGTTVEREWVEEQLSNSIPEYDPGYILCVTTENKLLDISEFGVRFSHQLLQDYFSACKIVQASIIDETLTKYWLQGNWNKFSGWANTTILVTEMTEDATAILKKLARVNPLVATRCLLKGNPQTDSSIEQFIANELITKIALATVPAEIRIQAGRMLAKLGDFRPGVGLRDDGLPDIIWCKVPAGSFILGSTDQDKMAFMNEKPAHEYIIDTSYEISRYPITNSQFAAFIEDRGYSEKRYWTKAAQDGVWYKGKIKTSTMEKPREKPCGFGEPFDLPNHPVVGITWYEAIAFCRWLTEQLHNKGELGFNQEISLPTEPQWEKSARGVEGRRYPWGEEPYPNNANYDNTGIGTTSAVGCFPHGASPYGLEDLGGNILEWTRTPLQDYPYLEEDREKLDIDTPLVLRGGAFYDNARSIRGTYRIGYYPDGLHWGYGFRVVRFPASREL